MLGRTLHKIVPSSDIFGKFGRFEVGVFKVWRRARSNTNTTIILKKRAKKVTNILIVFFKPFLFTNDILLQVKRAILGI